MYCPDCGKDIPDVSKVCGFCGFRLPVSSEPVDAPLAPAPVPEVPAAVEVVPQPQEAAQPAEQVQEPPAPPERAPAQAQAQEAAPAAQAVGAQAAQSPKTDRKLPGWAQGAIVIGAVALVVTLLFVFGVIDLGGTTSTAPSSASSASSDDQSFALAEGTWEAIDGIDGSLQTLTIIGLGSNRYRLEFYDDGATSCGADEDGNALVGAEFTEIGRAQDMSLSLNDVEIICLTTPQESQIMPEFEIRYVPDSDTIRDQWGDTWERVR